MSAPAPTKLKFALLCAALTGVALFFLFRFLLFPGQAVPAAQKFDQIECDILNTSGELIRSFPGEICLFLPDGSFISGDYTVNTLTRYSPVGSVVWQRDLLVKHQMYLSSDGAEVFFQAQENSHFSGRRAKYEFFMALDLHTGRTLKRFDPRDHLQAIESISLSSDLFLKPDVEDSDTLWEYAHANSINELPLNQNEWRHPAFKKGNYIVGFNRKGFVAILDSGMKNIIWHKTSAQLSDYHDAQVLPDGNILVYQNSIENNVQSRLAIYDPFSFEIVWSYQTPGFYAPLQGGVQLLENGNFLFSDQSDGNGLVREIDPSGKKIQEYHWRRDPKTGKYSKFQQVKRLQLGEFLRNNKL